MTEAQLPLRVRLFSPFLRKLRPAALATSVKRLLRIKRLVVRAEIGSFFVDPISHLGDLLIREGRYEPDMESTPAPPSPARQRLRRCRRQRRLLLGPRRRSSARPER